MSSIDGIVQVNITAGTAGVAAKAFGVGLVLGSSKNFAANTANRWRVREYNNLEGVKADFAETDPEYKSAGKYFGQNPRPAKLLIGQKYTDDVSIGAALTAVSAVNSGWYILTTCTRVVAEQAAASDWVQDDAYRVYIAATADPKSYDVADTTSLWALTKANDRTLVLYYTTASSAYPDAALSGVVAPYKPGSYTLKCKRLRGITGDVLTDTQKGVMWDKGINTYTEVGGNLIIENGKTNIASGGRDSGGEWFDIIVFSDWLRSRIGEGVFSVFINNGKIPYTMQGATMIESPVRSVLSQGQTVGGISPDEFDEDDVRIGGYDVFVIDPATMPTADKQARKYSGVTFVAFLAGAIHYTEINGTITY